MNLGIFASLLFLAREARSDGHVCDAQSLGQIPSLKGWWEPHDDPSFRGLYDAVSCPVWGKDWDCMLDGEATEEQRASVYKQVCFCPLLYSLICPFRNAILQAQIGLAIAAVVQSCQAALLKGSSFTSNTSFLAAGLGCLMCRGLSQSARPCLRSSSLFSATCGRGMHRSLRSAPPRSASS